MVHELNLHDKPFNSIKNKTKTVEIRLFDEKRQKIKPNDEIIFNNRVTLEKLKVKVIEVKVYKNFEELYKHYNNIEMGYSENEIADPNDMNIYYSEEEQNKYGVCAIKIKVI